MYRALFNDPKNINACKCIIENHACCVVDIVKITFSSNFAFFPILQKSIFGNCVFFVFSLIVLYSS